MSNLRGVTSADQVGRLEARIRDLERQTRTLPSRFGGGGGGAQNSHLYRLIGGNVLNGSGEIGIKKMSSTIASVTVVPDFAAATPSTLPDGLGWAVKLDDPNQYIIVINDARALTTYDLSAPCDIFTNYAVSVLDNDGDPFDAFIAVSPI
jgi:hypothetical protein